MGEPTRLQAGQLGTLHIWALGVGIVVCGQFFGWNLGLKGNSPGAMLAASLLVCLLFLCWALTLSELAVAMPTAGGPLDWGQRAGGPWLGFLMGWSMLLECFFGGVATALAGGNYVAFLLNPERPNAVVTVLAGLLIVVLFFLLQAWGVREQAGALVLMTFGALFALAVFWVAAGVNFSWPRAWPSPVLPADRGWGAVLDAVPYALWWLIIIEGAALAAEETHRPEYSIPRGMTVAVLTTAVLLVLTLGTACGALDSAAVATRGGSDVHFPLPEVLRRVYEGHAPLLLYGFGTAALLGLVASYHGLLYGTSRQTFALGRAGCLPTWLGSVHVTRQTPLAALAVGSVLTAAFIVANLWFDSAVEVAVLSAGFAALVLYILSMVCLVLLRCREPELFQAYRSPLPRLLPLTVVVLSLLALLVYPRLHERVVPVSLGAYGFGILCFALNRRSLCSRPAPTASREPRYLQPSVPTWLDAIAAFLLATVLLAAIALGVAATGYRLSYVISPDADMIALLVLLVFTLVVVAVLSLRPVRPAD